ncbi:aminotransferase class I/II-fold pyridoxal phosphate-dependent enzyme [Desulfofustis glycolicus]|uniref:Histidinol phosphate aminotransferase apoenzyme n=1 Tax=Desulfofustis glycolicus DSM 9705 TaxID=1121409 RepID=A0A1M5YSM6_9BACT|nr:aminotransferase class I/II-fold pyridoxal phosphate-dependent enzyme [Desulfofustis glycolicus]SHI15117.1 histidinol phosphate aminotransferase apoenzyme [Desulfofustis glycolicus DSM 9705]
MNSYLRHSLLTSSSVQKNYAHRLPAACDLSLVSGPCIWEKEINNALLGCDTGYFSSYPLPSQDKELIEQLADWEGVPSDGIWLTPGADAAIEFVLGRVLDPGDTCGILIPNFPRFTIVAQSLPGVKISYFNDISEMPTDLTIAVICTPNNPSTKEIPESQIRSHIMKNPKVLFVIDGVFDWTASYNLSTLCYDYPNLIVLKSFSKIGLAGLRLGYIITNRDNCRDMQTALSPFFVPPMVQKIGKAIVEHLERIEEFKQLLDDRFHKVQQRLGDRVERYSSVPFYLLKTECTSSEAVEQLFQKGISVVDGIFFQGLAKNTVRVSIGTPDQNEQLFRMLAELGI